MAMMRCNFFSESLGMASSMTVILPEGTARQIGMAGRAAGGLHPCLYLLHGLSDDDTIWLRRTSIERYAASLGLAVVMPNVHRSFYTDMAHGYRYWTFVSEELPAKARQFFHLSAAREDNFVAGLSMGGYGAFKMALLRPDRFCAAASLSGAVDMVARGADTDRPLSDDMHLVYGETPLAGTGHDLLAVAGRLAASGVPRPRLYQCCGTRDFLYEDNIRFREHARSLGFDLTYDEEPADHEWGYWDRQIQKVLAWLRPA